MSRCTGHCCERFNMRYSPEEFKKLKDAVLSGSPDMVILEDNSTAYPPIDPDFLKIADMIIPLPDNAHLDHNGEAMIEDGHSYPSKGFTVGSVGSVVVLNANWYTCKHFDSINRNCTNYENRPKMCKSHPYYDHCSGHCNYKKCTLAKREDAVIN